MKRYIGILSEQSFRAIKVFLARTQFKGSELSALNTLLREIQAFTESPPERPQHKTTENE